MSRLNFSNRDLFTLIVIFAAGAVLGPAAYGLAKAKCKPPLTLIDSFCADNNFIYPGLCPPDYDHDFFDTCRNAFGNGTQSLYDKLVSTSGRVSGEPTMMKTALRAILDICRFPEPGDPRSYPTCRTSQVIVCFQTAWSAFASAFKEKQDHHECLAAAGSAGLFTGLMTSLLLVGLLFSTYWLLNRKSQQQGSPCLPWLHSREAPRTTAATSQQGAPGSYNSLG